MASDEKWYFTKEQLANTPSRKCGCEADKELSCRQQAANFIQDMGQRLQVTQLCINTAIVYMHRFYMFHSFTRFHRNSIATAALFLAAKVEEQPRKLEHVIKVAQMCLHREQPPLDTKSELYAEQSQDLVMNENILLQTLGFDVAIDHPHTHVVRCCHLVRASKDLAQTSYFMASNSLHLTTMCLQYKPTVVACFCIHLACKWSNWEIPQSTEGKPWFWYVDKTVTQELLEQLTDEFLVIFEKCPSRLKRKIMALSSSQCASWSASFAMDMERKSKSLDNNISLSHIPAAIPTQVVVPCNSSSGSLSVSSLLGSLGDRGGSSSSSGVSSMGSSSSSSSLGSGGGGHHGGGGSSSGMSHPLLAPISHPASSSSSFPSSTTSLTSSSSSSVVLEDTLPKKRPQQEPLPLHRPPPPDYKKPHPSSSSHHPRLDGQMGLLPSKTGKFPPVTNVVAPSGGASLVVPPTIGSHGVNRGGSGGVSTSTKKGMVLSSSLEGVMTSGSLVDKGGNGVASVSLAVQGGGSRSIFSPPPDTPPLPAKIPAPMELIPVTPKIEEVSGFESLGMGKTSIKLEPQISPPMPSLKQQQLGVGSGTRVGEMQQDTSPIVPQTSIDQSPPSPPSAKVLPPLLPQQPETPLPSKEHKKKKKKHKEGKHKEGKHKDKHKHKHRSKDSTAEVEPIVITIPKEKITFAPSLQDQSLKIKIAKDKIGPPPPPLATALKIKIPKEKIKEGSGGGRKRGRSEERNLPSTKRPNGTLQSVDG